MRGSCPTVAPVAAIDSGAPGIGTLAVDVLAADVLAERLPQAHMVPLAVGRGVTELVLELEQLWPARLLVVSLAGFHVALAATGGEGAARIVVDTGSLEAAAQRVSGGQGSRVTGLREGEQHRLVLRANPSRGTIEVQLDGRTLLSQATLSPRARLRTPSVSVRSSEPLRLLSAELEASR